jgi:hypothetical protein
MGSADALAGPMAWIERRPPNWSLRVGDEWPRVLAAETPDEG